MDDGLLRHPAVGSSVAEASPAPPPAARVLADRLAAAALARRKSDPSNGGRMARALSRPRLGSATVTKCPSSRVGPAAAVLAPVSSSSSTEVSAPPPPSAPAGQATMPQLRRCPTDISSLELASSSVPPISAAMLGSCTAAPTVTGGAVSGEVRGTGNGRHDGTTAEKMEAPLLDPSSASACDDLSAATAIEAEEGWVHVGRGRRSSRDPPTEQSREGFERCLAFKLWARGRCFRCLERGHQVSACRGPFRCIRCRHAGHRERFCCARSPVARDHSSAARAYSPVTRAPCQRSCSPSMGHSSLRISVPSRSPSGCCKDSNVSTFLGSTLESQFALLRMELLQKVELLRTELHDALAKLQAASVVSLSPELQIGSVDEGVGCLFGEFSPRALPATPSVFESAVISELVPPVVQILPELQKPGGESSMMPSLESLAVDMTSSPPQPPLSECCQLAASEDAGGLVACVTSTSLSGEVDKTGVLASNSEALFGKEVCDLLVDLEAACPGYGKDIASILAGTASGGVFMKVEKSLRRRARKKLSVVRKASAFS